MGRFVGCRLGRVYQGEGGQDVPGSAPRKSIDAVDCGDEVRLKVEKAFTQASQGKMCYVDATEMQQSLYRVIVGCCWSAPKFCPRCCCYAARDHFWRGEMRGNCKDPWRVEAVGGESEFQCLSSLLSLGR